MTDSAPASTVAPSQTAIIVTATPLYVAFGCCLGLLQVSLPTILQRQGMAVEYAGLLALLFLPFGLSALWAPLVDRYRPFGLDRRFGWVVLCQSIVILSLLLAALAGPQNLMVLVPALAVLAFAAATMDVALDGYLAETASDAERARLGGMKVSGMYLGTITGAALALLLFDRFGWLAVIGSGAVLAALALVTFLVNYRPAHHPQLRKTPSFKEFFVARKMLGRVLLLALIGALLGAGLSAPRLLLVERGMSLTAIGTIFGIVSMCAGLAGALMGSEIGRIWTIRWTLLLAAILFAAGALALALFGNGIFASIMATGSVIACCAIAYGALYGGVSALALGWVDKQQAATDYSIVQSMWTLSIILGSALSGMALVHLGSALFTAAGIGLLAGIAWLCHGDGAAASRRTT